MVGMTKKGAYLFKSLFLATVHHGHNGHHKKNNDQGEHPDH
tara:strand:+ start:30825 stop:30947 length:123 start_codon:yes stop_codon:yes gene_type:complete